MTYITSKKTDETYNLLYFIFRVISEIPQLPVVQTEIVDLAANAVAAMLLEFLDTEDSSKISSLHFTKIKYQKTVPVNADWTDLILNTINYKWSKIIKVEPGMK